MSPTFRLVHMNVSAQSQTAMKRVRLLAFLPVALLVSCGASGTPGGPVQSAPTGSSGSMKPYFAGYGPAVPRVGATLDNNPMTHPALRQSIGGRQGGPPYGKAVGEIMENTFRNAGIPGSNGQERHSKFNIVAIIEPENPKVQHTSGGPLAVAPFEVTLKDTHGKVLGRERFTGTAPLRGQNAASMSSAILQASNLIAARLKDSEYLQRALGWPSTQVNSADVAVRNGAERFRTGDYTSSLHWFQQATHIDPSHQSAWSYLGASLLKLGRKQEASQALEKAIALNPSTAEAAQAEKWLASMNQQG